MRSFHLRSLLLLWLAMTLAIPGFAQVMETGNASGPAPQIDPEKTPWLEGVTISPVPSVPAPILPVELQTSEGKALPATLTEDVPVLLTVHSDLLGAKPPAEWNGQTLTNAEWAGVCSINWFFEDLGKNKSTQASCSDPLPMNQMLVTPLDPTQTGAVTVHLSRPMRYETEPGKFRRIYVTGGIGAQMKVLDITPPACGLELKQGKAAASVWAVEMPVHKNPPPKTADVMGQGTLLDRNGHDALDVVEHGVELGANGLVSSATMMIHLGKNEEVAFNLINTDNDRVDEKTVRFGFCEYANGSVKVLGEENPTRIKPGSLNLPASTWLFVEAKDPSGNLGRLIVPVQLH